MSVRERLIDKIYEAAAIPERWPGVLEDWSRAVGADGAIITAQRSDTPLTFWKISPDFEPAALQYFASGANARSQVSHRLIAADHAGFVTGAQVFTPEEWNVEPFVAWGRDWGYEHGAATAVQVPSGDFVIFHVQRRLGVPDFNARELQVLDSFRPHLARAGLLSARLQMERLRVMAETLALIGLPALVLDRIGRVLAANSLIERTSGHLRWLPRDRVAFADKAANTLLQQALVGLSQAASSAVRSFPARSPSESEQIVVAHLLPITGEARDIFNGALGVLMFTPVTANLPDANLIRALFDLTPGEARVAREIARGSSIDEIASRSRVDRETVRSQLKSVFAKTGTHRQAEVAALLAGLPRLPIGTQ
jgi:DNA-binding CsgD family transcriptional regulator